MGGNCVEEKDKKFLFFINKKREWESSPNMLVTKNPNWSQSLGKGTDCVKEMH